MSETLRDDPRTNINWRAHHAGCPHYRERWLPHSDVQAGEPLYQVFCLHDTPPVTAEEQDKCLHSHTICWRLKNRRTAKEARPTPESSQPLCE